MTIEKLFKNFLKYCIKQGYDCEDIRYLCGCTERKVVLTKAEAEAGKLTYTRFMEGKLWNDPEIETGWLFGSPKTNQNIGLIPLKLARERLRLNSHNWNTDSYIQF